MQKYFYFLTLNKSYTQDIQPETEPNYGEEAVVFIEESSKRQVNAYIDRISKLNKLFYRKIIFSKVVPNYFFSQ